MAMLSQSLPSFLGASYFLDIYAFTVTYFPPLPPSLPPSLPSLQIAIRHGNNGGAAAQLTNEAGEVHFEGEREDGRDGGRGGLVTAGERDE